jgi:hypothetical protein
MTDIDEMGPIDWILLEFRGPLTGEAAPPLLDLVDRGLIRILDILFLRKEADGTVEALNISELPDEQAVHISVFEGASSGLLGQDDVDAAGEVLEPDTTAVMLVYENTWAAPFAVAVRRAGGQLVDSGRIPVQQILAALEELEAAEAG